MKTNIWTCTSVGGCAASFVDWSMPYVQWVAAVISIVAGAKALWPWAVKAYTWVRERVS